jgi:hypothetical protein
VILVLSIAAVVRMLRQTERGGHIEGRVDDARELRCEQQRQHAQKRHGEQQRRPRRSGASRSQRVPSCPVHGFRRHVFVPQLMAKDPGTSTWSQLRCVVSTLKVKRRIDESG